MAGKLQLGIYWGAACGGCDVSVLDTDDFILEVDKVADVRFWPIAADGKCQDVEAMADGELDVTLFSGAVRNSGYKFPVGRVSANLAPADLKKAGPSYDLPIALGILMATEQLLADVDDIIFLGELSLDGNLRHTNGILPMVRHRKEATWDLRDEVHLLKNLKKWRLP